VSEIERIRDQFQRGWDGDAWHGTPLWTLLQDVTAKEANARPIAGTHTFAGIVRYLAIRQWTRRRLSDTRAHTIAEIVQHLAYWKWATVERVNGALVSPAHDEQWPPHHDASEAAWKETLTLLESRHQTLMQLLGKLSDEDLNKPIAGRDYDVYVQLHGTLQHDIYHTGQIALLKRAARA
jgi:hypothetical protein